MSPKPSSAAAIRRILSCVGLLWLIGGLQAQESTIKITAGPFLLEAPKAWADSIKVEEVSSAPLYSEADWEAYQRDSSNRLKPSYDNRPQHWAVHFPALALPGTSWDPAEKGPTAPQVLIHRSEDWASVFGVGRHTPDEARQKLSELRAQQTAMDKGDFSQSGPAFVDGDFSFVSLPKKLRFNGGQGYRLVGQYLMEPDILRRGSLHYVFIGLSDDSTCQVIATFPLDAPGLPKLDAEEHLGRSVKTFETQSSDFPAYTDDAVTWLTRHEKKFTPSLEALDRVIESLSAATWR